jgi:hypothetical protein
VSTYIGYVHTESVYILSRVSVRTASVYIQCLSIYSKYIQCLSVYSVYIQWLCTYRVVSLYVRRLCTYRVYIHTDYLYKIDIMSWLLQLQSY